MTRAVLGEQQNFSDETQLDAEEQPSDVLIDSREFLGTSTKFNRVFLDSISLNPATLTAKRKQFKFLSDKILRIKNEKISLNTFNLQRPNNSITPVLHNNSAQIPMQIKALCLLKTQTTNFDLQSIDFDPISNPQTQEVFQQNYLNIGKIQVLQGFERKNGVSIMNKPIYVEIDPKNINQLRNKTSLGRIIPAQFEGLTLDTSLFNVHDKVFLITSGQESVAPDNVQQLSLAQDATVSEEVDEESLVATLGVPQSRTDLHPFETSNVIIKQNPKNVSLLQDLLVDAVENADLTQTSEQTQATEMAEVPTATTPSSTGGGY